MPWPSSSQGQSSSIIATIVGQIICEGFISWKVRPFICREITRLIALIPCVVVASAIGKPGLSMALNISQISRHIVILLIDGSRLAFCYPLSQLHCSTSPRPPKPCVSLSTQLNPHPSRPDRPKLLTSKLETITICNSAQDSEIQDVEYVNMANGWIVGIISWTIWAFIAGLNLYLIVMLALGKS